jgi:uncharacterized membrane protein
VDFFLDFKSTFILYDFLMAEKEDFFAKKLSNSRSFKKRSRSSNWVVWVVALVVIFCLAGMGVYVLFFKSPNLVIDSQQELQFSLGSEITLQGELKMDGDIFTYTHTITDPTY